MTDDEAAFERKLNKMILLGWLIENPDGTYTVTKEGLEAADQFRALLESEGPKQ